MRATQGSGSKDISSGARHRVAEESDLARVGRPGGRGAGHGTLTDPGALGKDSERLRQCGL